MSVDLLVVAQKCDVTCIVWNKNSIFWGKFNSATLRAKESILFRNLSRRIKQEWEYETVLLDTTVDGEELWTESHKHQAYLTEKQ